ncbi:MAG: hypothetical protein EBU88_02955 [Acidobacteria bacterium]|nr:hypothetical protein [Acidobacteriota bacterium]
MSDKPELTGTEENQAVTEATAAPVGEVVAQDAGTSKEAGEEKEETTFHAVENYGKITAIWEMKGRIHIRTIDPQSVEGKHLLQTPESSEAAAG